MITLQAPLPNPNATTVLPNPMFGDAQLPQRKLSIKRAMDGTVYTYVKSNARNKLQYSFRLSRMKALELRAFIQSYYRTKVRLTNHKGEVWIVYFTTNPFEFMVDGAASWPGREYVTVTLEFEGVQQSTGSELECSSDLETTSPSPAISGWWLGENSQWPVIYPPTPWLN